MGRVLIAGCGAVGCALGARLASRGHHVWGLRRSAARLPEGIEPLTADLCDASSLRVLPPDLDRVFYLASAGGGDEAAYRSAYVEGLDTLLGVLTRRRESPRLLFTSSTAVYAQRHGEWVDETSPTEPRHFSGRVLLEAERRARESGLAATVVRLGGIYGPGRTRLLEQVRAGRATLRPGGPHYTNRIHLTDCAGALEWLSELAEPAPLYLGVDCEPAEEATVLRWLATRLGVPAPRPGDAPDPGGRRGRSSKRCSNARLLAAGYRMAYPSFREGYAALLDAAA